jgi:hypothetical protein
LITATKYNSHAIKVELLPDKLVLRLPLRDVKIQRINGKSIAVFKNPISGLTCIAELA